jgi:hypothetical protein
MKSAFFRCLRRKENFRDPPTRTGAKTLEAQIADGTAKVKGDAGMLTKLASTMIDFDPRFEIMPGTKAWDGGVAHADPYKAVPRRSIAE